jgi:hypothetical protein
MCVLLFCIYQQEYRKEYIKAHTTTEPMQIKKSLKQELNKNNILTNQDHTKGNIHQQNKWIRFRYFGHKTQQIDKIFKDTDARIAFRTTDTMQKYVQPKQQRSNKYDNIPMQRTPTLASVGRYSSLKEG